MYVSSALDGMESLIAIQSHGSEVLSKLKIILCGRGSRI